MTVKKVAAFHEAGHAITAHYSKFHGIAGGVNLADYGAGEIYISLNSSKLMQNGKKGFSTQEDGRRAAKDPDVAKDFAVVLCAGLVAERIAEEKHADIFANPQCAEPDHALMKQHLQDASASLKFDRHEETARELLVEKWELVNDLADHLFHVESINSYDLQAFITSRL